MQANTLRRSAGSLAIVHALIFFVPLSVLGAAIDWPTANWADDQTYHCSCKASLARRKLTSALPRSSNCHPAPASPLTCLASDSTSATPTAKPTTLESPPQTHWPRTRSLALWAVRKPLCAISTPRLRWTPGASKRKRHATETAAGQNLEVLVVTRHAFSSQNKTHVLPIKLPSPPFC